VLSCRVEYRTENFPSAERPQDLGDENSAVVHCLLILRSNDACAAPPVCSQAMCCQSPLNLQQSVAC
jgi:hypothetical protein